MRRLIVVPALAAALLQVPGSAFQVAGSARAIVSRADLVHTTPVTRREDGVPIGNGRMGARVWAASRALHLEINRADMDDAGLIELELAASGRGVFAVDGTHQRLSLYEGLLAVNAAGVNVRMLAWPGRDVVAIELDDRRTVPEPIQLSVRKRRSALQLASRGGRIVLTENVAEGTRRAAYAVAIAVLGRRTLTRLAGNTEARIASPAERGRIVVLIASAATPGSGQDLVTAAVGNLDAAAAKSFDDLAGDTAEWWHDFWQRNASALKSDDYHYSLYLMRATKQSSR